MSRQTVCVLFVATFIIASGTSKAEARELYWEFQDTGFSAMTSGTATALRSNEAWPMIFDGQQAYGLFATDPYWREVGPAFLDGPPLAKTSPDGRVLAFGATDEPEANVVVGSPSGGFATHQAMAGAFHPEQGTLALAKSSTLPSSMFSSTGVMDMAVASDGTKGYLTDDGRYVEQRGGQWGEAYLDEFMQGAWLDGARVTFDAQNRPHIAGTDGGEVLTASFSTAAGQWEVNSHGMTSLGNVALSSTIKDGGEVGLAWADEYDLYYSFLDSSGQWTSEQVTEADLFGVDSVGLAFDWEGLPVISYHDGGDLWLAYDPIPVPEPSSLALLGLGGTWLLMRRRSAPSTT